MTESFSDLTASLSGDQALILGVLACERPLVPTVFAGLNRGRPPREWLGGLLEREVLLDRGVTSSLGYARTAAAEHALTLAPALRPLLLRYLADEGQLDAVSKAGAAIVGDGSLSGFVTSLYGGDVPAIERAVPELKRRFPAGEEARYARLRLHEAVASNFDAAWLERTFGQHASTLAEQVLSDALSTLEPVTELYRWALGRLDTHEHGGLRWVACEHALLRAEFSALDGLSRALGGSERLALHAAQSYAAGDLALARRLLDEQPSKGSAQKALAPSCASVSALLSLLCLSQGGPEAAARARRIIQRPSSHARALDGWPWDNAEQDVASAIRTLLRRLGQPETQRQRLSAHQLPPHASAWETVIFGLTAQLQERDGVARAAWSRRLHGDGQRWLGHGYTWLGRQAQGLAKALAGDAPNALPDVAPCAPGELWLADLLEPKPEWQRALEALTAFAEAASRGPQIVSRRVAWFADMTHGTLARPALEEFREGQGWTRGRRLDVAELSPYQAELPAEDVMVLRAATRATQPGELLEALCGHPRVFNGARGRLPVEVVRGNCRIDTRTERGHLLLELTPSGVSEGVHSFVESETRLVVYRVSAAHARLAALLPAGMRVPESHAGQLLPILAQLSDHVEIRSPVLGAQLAVAADDTPCLRISPEAGAWWIEAGVRPFGARGRFFPPGLGRARLAAHADGGLLDTERNLEQELRRFQALVLSCPTLAAANREEAEDAPRDESSSTWTLGEEELFALLTELRDSSVPCNLEWKNARPIAARGTVSAKNLQGHLRRSKGWYIATGGVALDDVTNIRLAELVAMPFTKTGRFVRLPTGDFLEVERRVRQVLAAFASHAQRSPREAELKIPDAAFSALRPLFEANGVLQVDPDARDWFDRVDAALKSEPELPPGLAATLRSYQHEGYRWLQRHATLGLGVCLADDMGLGKTIQVLTLLLARRDGGPALVVAPTSVCSNWLEEVERFAPTLRAVEFTGKSRDSLLERFRGERDADLLIVSYALLQQCAAELTQIEWNTAVLDEAQFIKNAHSLRAKAAFELSANCRVALTGTPIENHLGDLWSIFHFLNPTLLGSWKHFQLRYLKPIERDQDSERREALKKLLQPFILRRMKDDVLPELPPITTLRHDVNLNEDEALRYGLLRRQIHEKLRTAAGKRDHKLQIFAEITRLRRFCCHPRLVFPDAGSESSKLQAFLELAAELRENGHRALVFSQFVDFLQIVREQLDERGIRYQYLDGSTPKAERQQRVQAFQTGSAELFLISLKAGGFGLNLTAADYVIHLDPWWNPAVEMQATDRAHRIGQTRPVTVYRLVTRDSIEEQIVALHRQKQAVASALLEGTDAALDLSLEQLRELLGPDSN